MLRRRCGRRAPEVRQLEAFPREFVLPEARVGVARFGDHEYGVALRDTADMVNQRERRMYELERRAARIDQIHRFTGSAEEILERSARQHRVCVHVRIAGSHVSQRALAPVDAVQVAITLSMQIGEMPPDVTTEIEDRRVAFGRERHDLVHLHLARWIDTFERSGRGMLLPMFARARAALAPHEKRQERAGEAPRKTLARDWRRHVLLLARACALDFPLMSKSM